MMKIFSAKGTIQDVDSFLSQITKLSKNYEVIIQAFNAELIYGKNHLISAVHHAQRAFEQANNSTNTLAMEILLYAAGERQIKKAIEKLGVKKGKISIAFVVMKKIQNIKNENISSSIVDKILQTFHLSRDDKILEGDIDTLRRFGITQNELSTLLEELYGDIILEKVAMVDIIK